MYLKDFKQLSSTLKDFLLHQGQFIASVFLERQCSSANVRMPLSKRQLLGMSQHFWREILFIKIRLLIISEIIAIQFSILG